VTVLNSPPVINDPKESEIRIYDGLTGSLSFTASDPENSNLLELSLIGTPPSWVTMTPKGAFSASPDI